VLLRLFIAFHQLLLQATKRERESTNEIFSTAPSIEYPALFTSTSILPTRLTASCITSPAFGEFTSRASHFPPSEVTWEYEGAEAGLRAVAMTVWPALRAWRAREAPRPVEQPVMSQVWGVVDAIVSSTCTVPCRKLGLLN